MRNSTRIGLAAALVAGLFAAGCSKKETPPVTGLSSVKMESPNPFGEIPYGRYLKVKTYEMDSLKDVHILRTGETVAVLHASFKKEYETKSNDNFDEENYEIRIVGESREDAQRVANNLSRYNIVMVIPPFDNGRGIRTDGVRIIPTEHGLVYEIPASSIRFSDLETYQVNTKQGAKAGTIDNNGVHRPWLSESQQVEKPCIPDEFYRSPCAVEPTAKQTPATKKPGELPKPTPKK